MTVDGHPPRGGWPALTRLLARILRFGVVSGLGVALDYVVYSLLVHGGVTAGWAYVVGATCGLTFVFVASVRHVFESSHGFRVSAFAVYAAYQVISVALGALAVEWLDAALDGRYLLAKTIVLPITFGTNFLFMSWLLSSRGPGGRARQERRE